MTSTPDPALEAAARALPDPASLTPTQRRAIRLAHTRRLIMVRGGWKAGTDFVSFKTTDPLETMKLVRRYLAGARWTLIATGAGMMVLDIIDERKASKGAKP